jgi:hypothetical protein
LRCTASVLLGDEHGLGVAAELEQGLLPGSERRRDCSASARNSTAVFTPNGARMVRMS